MSTKIKIKSAISALIKRKYQIGATLSVLFVFVLFQNCGSQLPATTTTGAQTAPTATPNSNTLILHESSTSVNFGGTISFYATGGSGSYTYILTSGTGSINASTGSYTAPNVAEADQVTVTDSLGNTSSAYLTVAAASSYSPTPTATVNPSATPSTGLAAGPYRIMPRSANLCMGVNGASLANAAPIIQWACLSGHLDQYWNLVPSGVAANTYKIQDVNSGQNLAVNGSSTANGAHIIQWPDVGSYDQLWQPVAFATGYQLINYKSGLCLGVNGGSTSQGAILIQWTCDSSANQTWSFNP